MSLSRHFTPSERRDQRSFTAKITLLTHNMAENRLQARTCSYRGCGMTIEPSDDSAQCQLHKNYAASRKRKSRTSSCTISEHFHPVISRSHSPSASGARRRALEPVNTNSDGHLPSQLSPEPSDTEVDEPIRKKLKVIDASSCVFYAEPVA